MIDFYPTPSPGYAQSDHYKNLSLTLKKIEDKIQYLNFMWVNHWYNVTRISESRINAVERLLKKFYSDRDCIQTLIQQEVILN
jgi:hypothetical protein